MDRRAFSLYEVLTDRREVDDYRSMALGPIKQERGNQETN